MPKNPKKAAMAAELWKTDPEYRQMSRDRKKKWYAKERNKQKAREYWQKNKELKRALHLKSKYGITPEDFDAMWKTQGGACKICRKIFERRSQAHIDHNHNTDKVRGLLCAACNWGIGCFKDSKDLLTEAIKYLGDDDG